MLILFLSIMLVFVVVLLFVVTSAFLGFLITRVPFVPTYSSDIEFIVKKLGISSRDIFYDLGSGDGKVCFLVNQTTGARCVGYELTWWTHLLANIKKWFLQLAPSPLLARQSLGDGGARGDAEAARGREVVMRTERVQFKNQNFFKHSWQQANYIYAYLYPPLMGRVEEKFLADCKPGSIAIIRDFPFPNLKPADIHPMPKKHEIYIYIR